jgi:hypothetical protein
MNQLQLSARAYLRILKLARTIADLAGSEGAGEDATSIGRSCRPDFGDLWGAFTVLYSPCVSKSNLTQSMSDSTAKSLLSHEGRRSRRNSFVIFVLRGEIYPFCSGLMSSYPILA